MQHNTSKAEKYDSQLKGKKLLFKQVVILERSFEL